MMKALVIALSPQKNVEDVIQIAKAEAEKSGFGRRDLLRVPDLAFLPNIQKWVVVVQNSGSQRGSKE